MPHSFVCFTENPDGLEEGITAIHLQQQWQTWWSKVNIFDGSQYSSVMTADEAMVFYIDLDMIVSGPIDELVLNFEGKFTTMSTNDIFCEQAQDGYNSSIMLFTLKDEKTQVQLLYDVLAQYYGDLTQYLMRFDHYLEMLVHNSDFI